MKLQLNIKLPKKLLFKVARHIINRVVSLKNYHHGESCYIFGDGVSIKWFDMSVFSDKPAFTLSYIPFHKQSNLLNIKYGLAIDPFYFYLYMWPGKWNQNNIQKSYRKFIKSRPDTLFFVNLASYPVLQDSNIYYLFRSIPDPDCKFLEDCYLSGEEIYKGSFRCAISLAIYMGFKKIFLVGCDYTHEKSKYMHWYEKGEGVYMPHNGYEKKFLEIASKYAKITTITVEGKGNVLPAVTYNELTGKQTIFKENQNLTDISTLNMLSAFPRFKIF